MKRIISVSRRTDIPALYADWFLNRLKEGFAAYHNPNKLSQRYLVSLIPKDVVCFVFWSKNYQPFLNALKTIDDMGYHSIFHFTITGLPSIFEPNVVKTQVAVDTLKRMSSMYSPKHIIWRYDPIIISDKTPVEFHIENFGNLASKLAGHVERCAFSYVDYKEKVRRNLEKFQAEIGIKLIKPDKNTRVKQANELSSIAKSHGMSLCACCEDYLVNENIEKSRCIDGDSIGKLFNVDTSGLKRDKGQRPECGCTESVDIGKYGTCPHGCVYCYANVNKNKAKKAYQNHDKNSAFLGYDKSKSDNWLGELNAMEQQENTMIVKKFTDQNGYDRQYRPHRISEVYGQQEAKDKIKRHLKKKPTLRHAILFHGISGTGKTTLARIIAAGLNCKEGPTSEPCRQCQSCKQIMNAQDFGMYKINAADLLVEDLRKKLRDQLNTLPWWAKYNVWIVDECHKLSDVEQTILLSPLEDAPEFNYFIFCTTETKGLIETFWNRCSRFQFDKLADEDIRKLLRDVCLWERISYSPEALDSIVKKADGKPRNALIELHQALGADEVQEVGSGQIEHIGKPGKTSMMVVAPHGVYHDDDYTGVIAKNLAKKLACPAVINEKYQKPETVGLSEPDLDRTLMDLNRWDQIQQYDQVKQEFLDPIELFKTSIVTRHGEALIVQIHGISDENMNRVANNIKSYKTKPENLHVLIGYGQSLNKNPRLTADEKKTIQPLIKHLKQNGINAEVAPTAEITDADGNKRSYCGNDKKRLNQKLCDLKRNVQCIQLEIRKTRFRKDPSSAQKAADPLRKAIFPLILKKSEHGTLPQPPKQEKVKAATQASETTDPGKKGQFWTALSKNSTVKTIRVEEIDLSDRKFESRIPDFGTNQEKFNDLVASIKANGILNNIIVRKLPDNEKYQLISGFRRLSALEKVLEERGEKDVFQKASVTARVFDSLTDEQVYQISFSENLAREDLSLWEIANSCRTICEELKKPGKSMAAIENHLARLTQRDPRTIRRYLRVSTIKNEDIRRDIHNGEIDITTAGFLAQSNFTMADREALYKFYKASPMSSRQLERFVKNIVEMTKWTKATPEKLLEFRGAPIFLDIESEELEKAVRYLEKATGRCIGHILDYDVYQLKKSLNKLKDHQTVSRALKRFNQQSKALEDKMRQAFETQGTMADVTIKPAGDFKDKRIKLTVSVPMNQAKEALSLVVGEVGNDLASLVEAYKLLPNSFPLKPVRKNGNNHGTREWSNVSINCCTGCLHDCRYCYSKADAIRFRHATPDSWKSERIRYEDVWKDYGLIRRANGRVMFPSSHDITWRNLDACCIVIEKLLNAGNRLLIVSKPRPEYIQQVCNRFRDDKENILFRFTITAQDDKLLSFWEPNAPDYGKRKESLKYAYDCGFETSVSVEPMLDSAHIEKLVEDLSPFVTDSIWIGKMNKIRRRVKINSNGATNGDFEKAIKAVEAGQTNERIKEIYEIFKDNSLIKWKDSIKKVVGIEGPDKPGMDV